MKKQRSEAADFTGKVVLITGAGRGLGRAIAEAFASRGAGVAANDVSPVNLDLTLQRIRQADGQARDYIYDVAKQMPVQNLVEQALSDWGRIDILVNNAAVRPQFPLLEFDAWDWQRTLEVNLSGAFFATQLVGKIMRQQGGGAIVNIAAALAPGQELACQAAFFASKLGLIGLTRVAAIELAAYHIRVNAICPGEPPGSANRSGMEITAQVDHVASLVDKVLYLCSPAAGNLTGQVIDMSVD
jgi:NAD(P)-dependent dehydrogenase (short-subunit alcohol dehydrogenase family)